MIWYLFGIFAFLSGTFTHQSLDSLDFFVIGDWGGVPYPPFSTNIERSISRRLVDVANTIKIDFLLALGDNFYYNGVENEFDSRFNTSFENVFKNSDLHFPWYFVAGNHDWRGNVSAQIAYSNYSSRWNFPNYFYTIEKTLLDRSNKKIAIIMIDTILLCGQASSDFDDNSDFFPIIDEYLTNVYWKFIKDELMRVKDYAYVFVAGHYPVWSVGNHGPTKCLVNQLDPLLKQFNVSAYINGHDHTVEHIQVPYENQRSMNYFTVGAANFYDNNNNHQNNIPANSLKFHWNNNKALGGFALFRATSNTIQFDVLSTDGKSLYSMNISPRN